ncbi:hypothetical protein [Paenarthrobacter sp. NEAU-H11]|uniref:hypothetical protein n=1 Tax=Paenarthrobacter sp. NEAU-H11 TaxID=3423924 RepID=UPI003D349FDA
MARIYPTQQTSNRADFFRRLYKLSEKDTVRNAGREASRDARKLTKSVSKLIDAVRSAWPPA